LLVPERRHDEALELAVQVARSSVVGDPQDERTQVGPMISRRNRDRAMDIIAEGRRDAVLAVGGQPPPVSTGASSWNRRCSAPRPPIACCHQGDLRTVVCLIPYRTEEEAIEIANDTVYGLSAGVWVRISTGVWRWPNGCAAGPYGSMDTP